MKQNTKQDLYKMKLQSGLSALGQRSSAIINAYYKPFISMSLKLVELDNLLKELKQLESVVIELKRASIFLDNTKND